MSLKAGTWQEGSFWGPHDASTLVCGIGKVMVAKRPQGLVRSGQFLIFFNILFWAGKLETLVWLLFGSPGRPWVPVGYNGTKGTTIEVDKRPKHLRE